MTIQAARLAKELLKELGVSATSEPRYIDVFGAIRQLNVELLFQKLDNLLGLYISAKTPGILITTERSLSIQRFTAAHELGHHVLNHNSTLDNEETVFEQLSKSPVIEREADAFASEFLSPRWLMAGLIRQREWAVTDPKNVYQLSLRLGMSYEATVRNLYQKKLLPYETFTALRTIAPREIKQSLVPKFPLPKGHLDIWLLDANDRELQCIGSPNDIFLFKLKQRIASGVLWNLDEALAAGFDIVSDYSQYEDKTYGGPTTRSVIAKPRDAQGGNVQVVAKRPWQTSAESNGVINIAYDLQGAESGLPRFLRK